MKNKPGKQLIISKETLKHTQHNGKERMSNVKQDFEDEEKRQAAADVLSNYSKFIMASIGNQVRPCDLRLHLMKEVSGMPTSLRKESPQQAASPGVMGESSSSGKSKLDRADSFRAL